MREQLDLGYVFGGIRTFGQRPFLTDPEQLDAWQPDVAIVGAPFDIATTNRPGARFGPRAIRALAYEPGTYHLDLGIEIFDHIEVVDYGDAYCPHGQTEVSHANIRARVYDIASRGIVPIVLGGDHSITWPAATAVADVHGYGNVGIVHFDAHADTADIIDGNLASHGTPMRRLIESGAVPGDRFVQVGLRGYWPPAEVFAWMAEQSMVWHSMQEIWERGFKAVMDDAVSEALARAEKLYISLDVDSLDPCFAPGTGTPEPGGLHRSTCCAWCASWRSSTTSSAWTWSRSRPTTTSATSPSTSPTAWCSRRWAGWRSAAGDGSPNRDGIPRRCRSAPIRFVSSVSTDVSNHSNKEIYR